MICSTGQFAILALLFLAIEVEFPQSLSAETNPPIEYVYPDQSVWTTKTNADGVLKNPLLHVAEALFSKLQLTWSASSYPAARMFDRLIQGKSNFSILVKAPNLVESCIFSQKPIAYTELRVYRKKIVPAIDKLDDLRGKEVILIRGYSYAGIGKFLDEPENKVTVNKAKRHEDAFEMLRHDRASYLLDYLGPSEEILAINPIADVTYDVLDILNVYLVLSKKYPEAHNMMSKMEEVMTSIDVTQWGLQKP